MHSGLSLIKYFVSIVPSKSSFCGCFVADLGVIVPVGDRDKDDPGHWNSKASLKASMKAGCDIAP